MRQRRRDATVVPKVQFTSLKESIVGVMHTPILVANMAGNTPKGGQCFRQRVFVGVNDRLSCDRCGDGRTLILFKSKSRSAIIRKFGGRNGQASAIEIGSLERPSGPGRCDAFKCMALKCMASRTVQRLKVSLPGLNQRRIRNQWLVGRCLLSDKISCDRKRFGPCQLHVRHTS